MNLQDTVLAMTVAVVEVARTGRDALIGELVLGGLTEVEAQAAVDEVIQVRLAPKARKVRVLEMYEAGMTQRQIAAELDVHHTTVGRDLGADASNSAVDNDQSTLDVGADAPDEPDQEGGDVEEEETSDYAAHPAYQATAIFVSDLPVIPRVKAKDAAAAIIHDFPEPARATRSLRRYAKYLSAIADELERTP